MVTTSLSGLGLSGLSSGLDTTSIITKLMSIESAPQTALKSQLSDASTYRSALQSLNTSVASIATIAQSASQTGSLASFTATSDTPGVTATASSTASAGSVSFTVDQLASAQTNVSAAMSSWDVASTPSLTFRRGGDATTDTTVTFTSGNLDDVVAKINGSGAGVTATKVAAGGGQYRLQLRSATGATNAFAVSAGTTYAQDDSASLGLSRVGSAQDAQITLYADTPSARQVVTSATNTFDDLLTGVDVTVAKTTSTAATISVAPDASAATAQAQALTAGLIQLFSGIAASTAVSSTTSSTGSTTGTTGGVFTGDSTVRNLKDALLSAVSGAVGSSSPSSIGIVLTKDGTITFDQSKFAAAMASDPKGTTAMFQTIAGRVGGVATASSAPYTGTVSMLVQSEQGVESSLTKQISDWDTRLATIQAQYTNQFNALETALNTLNSQASYLTSQISGLTTNYQKS